MAIIFKLTNAGRQALINAAKDGTQARRIVSVGITATAFTPTATIAAVPGEIKRISTIAGDVVAADTIHVIIRDDGNSTYTLRGLGLYLDNGVLLGTYSQADVILEKSPDSIFLLATDLRVLDGSVDISTLQFGETNFLNPPATIERQGVVQLATKAIAEALTDATRALTAASVAGLFAARVLATRNIKTGEGLDGGGDLSEDRTLKVKFGIAPGSVARGDHLHEAATQNANGFMSAVDKKKLDGIAERANNYALSAATSAALGGVMLGHSTVQAVAASNPSATDARTYPVQADGYGRMVVNVPWMNTLYTLPDTGVEVASYGNGVAIPQFSVDAQGRITRCTTVANLGFGISQTYKDVTATKPGGVVHTNITRRAISIQVSGRNTAPGVQIELLIDGVWKAIAYQGTVTGQTSTTIVMPDQQYRFPVAPVSVWELS